MKHRDDTILQARLPLVDAVRAVLASTIAWHHFVLYGPLVEMVPAEVVASLGWLRDYRWVVQSFFVVGGFVMARTMTRRNWDCRQVSAFVVRRYCRLGLPYVAAITLAVGACAVGRGSLPEEVVPPPSGPQVLAHVVFLQDILGYPSLSAGLWFVCIDFQLSVIYVLMLLLRDTVARHLPSREWALTWAYFAPGWLLAAGSLFFFNADPRFDVWAVYYFGYFFLGIILAEVIEGNGDRQFDALLILMSAALAYRWRWHLLAAMLTGIGLFLSAKLTLLERWPGSRVVAYLGLTSYSLFLIHFPVLVIVATAWLRLGWTSPWQACAGLMAAYIVSLIAADLFFRAVELPATRFSRRCRW